MKIKFVLGLGFINYLFLKGLPKPALWIKDMVITYSWKYQVTTNAVSDNDRDKFKAKLCKNLIQL